MIKYKVILLPTTDKSKIGYLTAKGEQSKDLHYTFVKIGDLRDINLFRPHDLYIASDELYINKGDWCIYKNEIMYCEQDESNIPAKSKRGLIFLTEFDGWVDARKANRVIASTNELLNVTSISDTFIQEYIKQPFDYLDTNVWKMDFETGIDKF